MPEHILRKKKIIEVTAPLTVIKIPRDIKKVFIENNLGRRYTIQRTERDGLQMTVSE